MRTKTKSREISARLYEEVNRIAETLVSDDRHNIIIEQALMMSRWVTENESMELAESDGDFLAPLDDEEFVYDHLRSGLYLIPEVADVTESDAESMMNDAFRNVRLHFHQRGVELSQRQISLATGRDSARVRKWGSVPTWFRDSRIEEVREMLFRD